MATIPQRVSYIYNPQNQSKEELIDAFVVRLQMFQKLWKEIKEVKMEHPEQHYLILGKRGQGKTTLLLRLAYEIENDAELNTWMIPIVFNEEEYSIRKLYKFWLRIMQLLEEQNEDFEGLYQKAENLSVKYPSDEEYERALADLLLQSLKSKEKKVILFIDNFGDMFNKFKEQEAHRLRKILNTVAEIRIFGASSKALEVSYDYKHPFYEFFKTERLSGLNKNETTELLLKLGEEYKQEQVKEIVENQKGRIEALRRISNGVIRTIVLLFEIFVDDQNGNAFSDLEGILDRVTPLYKHRMDDLSAQQQEIVEVIALNWDAVSVKEIAQQTRMESKKVSAQLTQLLKNEIIQKIPTTTKNHLYQLEERFFNIWYLMRHGRRGDSRRVLWLVRFFEEWCDEEQLVKRVEKHIEYLKNGDYNTKAAYFITEALINTKHISDNLEHKLLLSTKDYLKLTNSEFLQYLSKSKIELLVETMQLILNQDTENAIKLLSNHHKKDGSIYALIGDFQIQNNQFSDAEAYFRKSISTGNTEAMEGLARLFIKQKMFVKAEEYYLKVIQNGFFKYKYQLAKLYHNQRDYIKAKKYYIEYNNDNKSEHAMYDLAKIHMKLKKYTDAIKYYLIALNYFEYGLPLFSDKALNLNRIQEFFKDLLGDIYLNTKNIIVLDIKKQLWSLFQIQGDNIKAKKYQEAYYLEAVEQKDWNAANELAWMYFTQKIQKKDAFKYAQITFDNNRDSLHNTHTLACIQLWNNLPNESWQTAQPFIYDTELAEKNYQDFILYFQLLLAKEQYQTLYDYFNSEKAQELHIKDRFKPIWYVLMYYMQDQYPNEYLKMGGELEETVEEIIAEVEQMRVDYA